MSMEIECAECGFGIDPAKDDIWCPVCGFVWCPQGDEQ